jgi:hypothetical protein
MFCWSRYTYEKHMMAEITMVQGSQATTIECFLTDMTSFFLIRKIPMSCISATYK